MGNDQCPLCTRTGREIVFDLPDSLVPLILANAPGWRSDRGVCRECLSLFEGADRRLKANPKIFREGGYHILPTSMRVCADERFAGRGVTIAFLDSGFYQHPDLSRPRNRILHYINVTDQNEDPRTLQIPNDSSWHGMMTSVVAAGNGFLSNGVYRGLASEADLALIKAGSAHRILHDDIRRGFEWVLEHHRQLNIRIVNVSCGGDYEASYLSDGLSQAAEAAVREGIVVVCAAGNSGGSEKHAVLPPASAPSVITVGGFNDNNTLELRDNAGYHSSYGPTMDGLHKPEVIAPSIWIAAPILPDTPTAAEARLYERLQATPDGELQTVLKSAPGVDSQLDAVIDLPVYLIRQLLSIKIHDANVISGHYKHVDGSSFAAPIVSSVVAQMLEANPGLKPVQVKRILMETAIRIESVAAERQGAGVIIPAQAVRRALELRTPKEIKS
jgi:serine protease AprX